ncbi:MAG: molybdenum cofactor guanylyltransferase [Gemmatimonadales bacterium]
MRGAVLAGGTASRFGGIPKGLESVGGERILDRVVRSLQDATGSAPLLVANAPEAAEWRPDLEVVPDAIRNCGSLGGIYTALTAGEGPVLVAAWDMPFLTSDLLTALMEASAEFDACLPAGTGAAGLEPLCAVYGPACKAPIRERLAGEDFRASGFLDDVNAGTLALEKVSQHGDPSTLFFNVNTTADLATAQELWRNQQG